MPWSTSGSQKCSGANPSFIIRAKVKIIVIWSRAEVMVHCPVLHAFISAENRTIIEAVACVKKYFVAASIARG